MNPIQHLFCDYIKSDSLCTYMTAPEELGVLDQSLFCQLLMEQLVDF